MTRRTIGIAMNGVTGRMGYRQHLMRSILALREQGGLELGDGTVLWPEPILVGRHAAKLEQIAVRHGLERWTTSLDEALAEPDVEVYFDAQVTSARVDAVRRAIDAGKHVYTEKPTAESLADALDLARAAEAAGVCAGVVQDKLFLPGSESSAASWRAASSGASCPSAASSDTGCSRATSRRRNARRGTTGQRTVAESCSTCSRTGGTCSIA